MRFLTARYTVAATLLCAWACAKSNDQPTGDDSYTPVPGKGGASSTSGGNGGTFMTGGSTSPTTGGSSTGGSSASGGGALGGSTSGGATGGGNAPGAGGNSASGGSNATGGTPGAGGTPGTGGSVGTGGSIGTGGSVGGGATGGTTGSGGMPAMGAGGSGPGTGGSSYMFDPTFKPPDMTKFAKMIVLYQAGQTAKSATNIQFSLLLKNMTDAAYPMGKVTVRYWMSAEPAPMTALDYAATNLSCKGAPKFVTNHADSYLEFSFGTAGTLPPSTDQNAPNEGNVNGRVQSGVNNENFDQSNDWSFSAAASGMQPNPKITVYDGTTLIWGCEPTQVCATADSTGGEAGAGGAPAL
jgi:hypothetical protein